MTGGKEEYPSTYSRKNDGDFGTNRRNKEKNYYTNGGTIHEAPAMRTGVRLGALTPYLTLPTSLTHPRTDYYKQAKS